MTVVELVDSHRSDCVLNIKQGSLSHLTVMVLNM